MPVHRRPISRSQLCELLGLDPSQFLGLEPDPVRRADDPRDPDRFWIVLDQGTGDSGQVTLDPVPCALSPVLGTR